MFGYLNGFQTTEESLKHAFHHPRTKPGRITTMTHQDNDILWIKMNAN
jgi:hypothetical protein